MAADSKIRDVLVTATPKVLKELARAWFLRGFSCSGYKAHGETRLRDSVAFERLLEAEFERAWGERRLAAAAVTNPKPPIIRKTRR